MGETILLSERDAELLAALLADSPEPNERLLAAAHALMERERTEKEERVKRQIECGLRTMGEHPELFRRLAGIAPDPDREERLKAAWERLQLKIRQDRPMD
jgi:hypothetical protein